MTTGSGLVTHRVWAWSAAPAYTAVALIVLVLPERHRDRLHLVLGALVVAVLIVPIATLALLRSHDPGGFYAQSDTVAVEAAAVTFADGGSPYDDFERDDGSGNVTATGIDDYRSVTRDHFVYLPAMAVFGLPRAVGLPGALGDARLWMLAATLGCAWIAYRPSNGRDVRLAVLAFLASPLLAVGLAVGNTDAPVVALLLLGLVLCTRLDRRAVVAFGLALALKQTAVLVPVVLLVATPRIAGLTRRSFALGVLAIGTPATLAFLAFDRRSFLDDVVRFPLVRQGQDLTQLPPGVAAVAQLHGPWATGVVWVAALMTVPAALVRLRPPGSVASAATVAGLFYFAAWVALPSFRFGTGVYWTSLLAATAAGVLTGQRRGPVTEVTDPRHGPDAGSGTPLGSAQGDGLSADRPRSR